MFESNELNVGDLIKFDGNGLSPNYDTIVKVRPKSVITIGSGIVKIKDIIWTQRMIIPIVQTKEEMNSVSHYFEMEF